MKTLYGQEYECTEKLENIQKNLEVLKGRSNRRWDLVKNLERHPEVYKPFLILLLVISLQQLSGTSIMRSYVVIIFQDIFAAGSQNQTISEHDNCNTTSIEAYAAAICLSVVRLLASILLSHLLYHFGRRPMYLFSLSSTVASLCCFATCALLIDLGHFHKFMPHLALLFACCQVFSAQLGLQTLPNIFSGEFFAADIRAILQGHQQELHLHFHHHLSNDLSSPECCHWSPWHFLHVFCSSAAVSAFGHLGFA